MQRLTKAVLKERKANLMAYIAKIKDMSLEDALAEVQRVCPSISIRQPLNETEIKIWLIHNFIDDHTLCDSELW
jgi:hypothetical protein